MSDELKPCPFCGGDAGAQTDYGTDFPTHYVMCNQCNTQGDRFCKEYQAIAAWNRRTP